MLKLASWCVVAVFLLSTSIFGERTFTQEHRFAGAVWTSELPTGSVFLRGVVLVKRIIDHREDNPPDFIVRYGWAMTDQLYLVVSTRNLPTSLASPPALRVENLQDEVSLKLSSHWNDAHKLVPNWPSSDTWETRLIELNLAPPDDPLTMSGRDDQIHKLHRHMAWRVSIGEGQDLVSNTVRFTVIPSTKMHADIRHTPEWLISTPHNCGDAAIHHGMPSNHSARDPKNLAVKKALPEPKTRIISDSEETNEFVQHIRLDGI